MLKKRYITLPLLLLSFWGSMALDSQLPLTLLSFNIADYYERKGTCETRYNRSKEIDWWARKCGGKPGGSWCMYFVTHCYDSASKVLKVKNPLLMTGSCWRELAYANDNYFSKLDVIPVASCNFRPKFKRGDIAIFKHGMASRSDIGSAWNGHTGIVDRERNDGKVVIIEGNTNARGSREGGKDSRDGVARKTRNPYQATFPIIAIIRVKRDA